MIQHTMIDSFDQPLPVAALGQCLAGIERAMLGTGTAQSVVARRHLPVPGEGAVPALIATEAPAAIVGVAVADAQAEAKGFTAPDLPEVLDRWQARRPYKVTWANSEPLI
ncbi:hypothetical protein AB0B21_37390 [Streptomyces rimosus]|uniref:hypothetical protein n=1 Tax=Streptomyces rimosus TaxID=1927 RepID=UPI000518130E|nr:hypothetical protein [Streptomyces rimosus]